MDALLAAEEERRAAVQRFEALRAEQKTLGKQVATALGEEKAALLRRTKELAVEVKAAETAAAAAEQALRRANFAVSNVVEEGAPAGGEEDFVVIRENTEGPYVGNGGASRNKASAAPPFTGAQAVSGRPSMAARAG